LSHLRRLKLPPPEREPVRFLPILRRAEAEIADLILAKRITTSFLIGQNVALLADPRLLYILVRDALATVVRRVAPSSTVEVRADLPEGPNPGRVEVLWTGGRAMLPSQSDLDALFDPWAETVDGTANLDLSVPFRIARVFGWKLSTIGDVGCDGLRITIPPDAFALESGR
jgi:hypothetical protein